MKTMTLLLILLISFNTFGAKHYVKGIQKVTFRTGAGTDSKIIKMLEADNPVVVENVDGEWSLVKDQNGKLGYILTRFLTKEIPPSLRYKWLLKKYEKLVKANKAFKSTQKELELNIKNKDSELVSNQSKLDLANSSFASLKSDSSDFLKVQTLYKKTNELLDFQTTKVQRLEKKLSKHYIYWFLAGAGVLLLGLILGLLFKKRKSVPGLSF